MSEKSDSQLWEKPSHLAEAVTALSRACFYVRLSKAAFKNLFLHYKMKGTRGEPCCAAGNAQQSQLHSISLPSLMVNVHPACMPSPGVPVPCQGTFLQVLPLLTVSAGKCYLILLQSSCVFYQKSCGLQSCSWRAPRGFSFAPKLLDFILVVSRNSSMKNQNFGFF